ncbi:MAG: hypothetical protein ACLFQ3_09755 [Thiohalorhabdus sp.]
MREELVQSNHPGPRGPVLWGGILLTLLLLAACGADGDSDDGGEGTGEIPAPGESGDDSEEEEPPQRAYTPDYPADTWVQQDPEVKDPWEGDTREPEYRPYAGVAAGDGRVYYWGGGHKTHDGNDIDAYDVRANEWVQLTEEEDWTDVDDWDHLTGQEKRDIKASNNAGWEVDLLSPRGRPVTKHSYGQMAWWPGQGYCLLKQRLWCYDPEKGDQDGAWTDLTPNPFADIDGFNPLESIAPWNLTYDPNLFGGTVVSFLGAAGGRVMAYDPEARAWVTVNNRLKDGTYTEVYSAYDPESGWHIVSANGQWQMVNTEGESREMAQLRNNGSVVTGSLSMEWAPELGKVLVMKGIDDELRMWTYDPETDTWSDFELKGEGPNNAHAKWDTLARDPETGVYVLLAKEDQRADDGEIPETWTFWLSGERE